jgi:hypothetical protein
VTSQINELTRSLISGPNLFNRQWWEGYMSYSLLTRTQIFHNILWAILTKQSWHLNSGLHDLLAGTLPLQPCPIALFAIVILEIESCFLPRQAWTWSPYFKLPTSLGWQACTTTPSIFLLRWGSHTFFCLGGLELQSFDLSLQSK